MLGPEAFDIGYPPDAKFGRRDGERSSANPRAASKKLLTEPDTAPDRKERVKKALGQYDAIVRRFHGSYIVPPTETFERRTAASTTATCRSESSHLGRANTEGRCARWLPRQKIVATGDIVVRPSVRLRQLFRRLDRDHRQDQGAGLHDPDPRPRRATAGPAYLDKLVAAMADIRAQVVPLAKAGPAARGGHEEGRFHQVDRAVRHHAAHPGQHQSLFFDPMTGSVYKEALGQPIVQGEAARAGRATGYAAASRRAKRHKS